MTIELTAMERAAITAAKEKATREGSSKTDAVYLLGIRAGMERAAAIAEAALAEKMNIGPMWIYHRNVEHDIREAVK